MKHLLIQLWPKINIFFPARFMSSAKFCFSLPKHEALHTGRRRLTLLVICADISMCVWACKLRTALEARWLCVRACVFVVAARCLPTHTSKDEQHLNRMKESFHRQMHSHTNADRITMNRRQTGKLGHTFNKKERKKGKSSSSHSSSLDNQSAAG